MSQISKKGIIYILKLVLAIFVLGYIFRVVMSQALALVVPIQGVDQFSFSVVAVTSLVNLTVYLLVLSLFARLVSSDGLYLKKAVAYALGLIFIIRWIKYFSFQGHLVDTTYFIASFSFFIIDFISLLLASWLIFFRKKNASIT